MPQSLLMKVVHSMLIFVCAIAHWNQVQRLLQKLYYRIHFIMRLEQNMDMQLLATSAKVESGARSLLIIQEEQALVMIVLGGHILQQHALKRRYT